jgi:sarcosine oxidase subunit alpha
MVDGRAVAAFEGEPVAVALLAAGRPVLSRSFRLHRPRGLMCSTGQCGWCECRIDGRPSVRACRAPSTDGLVVEGEHALPSVDRDVLGLIDRGARWIPPTFYHHRFLRPRRLRKRYLDVIRWFGGRGRMTIPPDGPEIRRVRRSIEVDVAVVGGGPAGLLAARGAARAGARVVIVEAESEVGGPWRWRVDDIPGVGPLGSLLTDLEADQRVTIETGTTALSVDETGLHAVGPDALLTVRAPSVVVATGSYEQLPLVPGNDRPGVMGARTVEWLIRGHGVVPGERAVLVGERHDLERAEAALRAAGVTIVTRVATPALASIEGALRVTGTRHAIDARARGREAADLVVIGDRRPAAELALAAVAAGADPGVGVSLAGAAAGRPVDTPDAAAAAMAVGTTAAAGTTAPVPAADVRISAGSTAAMACFCEDVRVRDLVHEGVIGYAHPELVKRRTGALTGPCQGKYCGPAVAAVCRAVQTPGARATPAPGAGATPAPTTRPPARPVRLGDLVVTDGGVDR